MQLEILGNGPLAEYAVNGTVVKIGGEGGVEINCAALQMDAAVTVDICRDPSGNLVRGVADGVSYVASLIIPPQEKSEQLKVDEAREPVLDDEGNEVYEMIITPLNMGKVRLSLWPFVNPEPVSREQL